MYYIADYMRVFTGIGSGIYTAADIVFKKIKKSVDKYQIIRYTIQVSQIKDKAWDLSSAGRASALQAEGHRFEPCRSH